MAKRRNKPTRKPVEEVKEEVEPVEEVKEEEPEKKYVLTRDVNLSLRKGMEVSAEKYGQMVAGGLEDWFK